jgi:hypothetical protein
MALEKRTMFWVWIASVFFCTGDIVENTRFRVGPGWLNMPIRSELRRKTAVTAVESVQNFVSAW